MASADVYAGDPQLWKSFRDKFKELIKGEVSDTKELRDILETAICYFSELETDPTALVSPLWDSSFQARKSGS